MITMNPVPGDAASSRPLIRVSVAPGDSGAPDPDSALDNRKPFLNLRTSRMPQKAHILIVDDDEWIRDVLVRVLLRNQYEVSTAASGEEALQLLGQNTFTLLICDIMMNGMSGLDLLPRITALYPDLPIILITGYGDTDMMRQAFRYGACDFIPKPFTIETIPFIVERNLERHAMDRQRSQNSDKAMRWATVQALASAIDAKQPFTAEHSRRVARFSVAIAEAMELPRSEVRFAQLAAEVHDVGKLGIPDSILTKPGPLNAEERKLIEQHAEVGAQIVGRIEQLSYVAEIVRHHHEWVNGGGYPLGLKGDDIPLLSRIIAVADAYEVMTSNRAYRNRLTNEEAISRLQAAAGEQFDPDVVAAFLGLGPDTLPI